ncbi:hypothetical protein tb265_41360 [Gemmatimonadetes bacterium T265]|nr:hypothetical protein tb265_41360 [Gemmatimonadetes bacterium T265]
MSDFLQRAGSIGRGAWGDEQKLLSDGLNDYSAQEARLATVHGRQDVSAIAVLLDGLNVQLRALRRTAFLILLVAFAILFVLVRR